MLKSYIVDPTCNNMRLDRWIRNTIGRIPQGLIEKSLRSGKIKVNKKVSFSNIKVAAAFHGGISLNQQKKIPKVLKLMQFPCVDALSYAHLAEGKVDVVIQCANKIWDIHPLMPIINAAGGIVSTWKNENATNAGDILVTTNRTVHNKLVKMLKPVSK